MSLPFQYAYLLGAIFSFLLWIAFYIYRKDLRKEMIIMGLLIAIAGIISQYLWWTIDWWKPQTITNTRIGIEDILLGFSNGGVAAVLYEVLFRKNEYKFLSKPHTKETLISAFFLFLITALFFNFLHFHSFIGTAISYLLVGTFFVLRRQDLFFESVITGICLMIGSIPIYLLLNFLSPNFLSHLYYWGNLSGLALDDIPIEDLVYYFLAGFLVAPFYLYWKGLKLRRVTKRHN